MNTNKYIDALNILFSKNSQELTDIARKNNNTISTIEICYLCYNRNLLPMELLENFDYTKFLQFINIQDTKNVSDSDIKVSTECCYFIDKFSEFAKLRNVMNARKHKSDYYANYIAYLFLTDEKLSINSAIKQCISMITIGSILESIRIKLMKIANIPYDKALVNHGKFLTNPFDNSLSECYHREKEITDIIDILCRKNKNNPLLIGQPGVGKTAVVQGVANLLMSTQCPKQLEGYHIFELYMSSIIGGAKFQGDVEKRVTDLLEVILSKCSNVILFIDEIHTIVNGKDSDSTSSNPSVPVVDILKPYMTGSKLKLIGATTESEYKILEKDKALLRRFNKVSIKEPNRKDVLHIMESICKEYETYFDLKCSNSILSTVVNYADLYIPNRFMPDKAIDLLDQSFVHCKNHSKRNELTDEDIISSVETMTSVSIPTPKEDISTKISNIINNIKDKLVGQEEVIEIVESMLKKYFMGLCNPKKPISSFLFVGPTGVGKTALCKELATNLFNKESFVKLDMSEYMEKYSVSKLIGSPPGYVGHSKGGKLTEIVKHNPYSLILFDEIEKAHSDIYNILLQILDEGVLTDSEGYTANFKNCIIVLTSNLGAKDVAEKSKNALGFGDNSLTNKDKNKIYEQAIKKYFSPEFINRLEHIVYFNSLTEDDIANIVDIELSTIINKFKNIKVTVNISENTKKLLYIKCYTKDYGARFVQREVTRLIEDKVVEYLLESKLIGIETTINIDVVNEQVKILQFEEVKV